MAKIIVEDLEDQTRIPFLKGILIRSLQDAGVQFKDAYAIASDIRNDLSDRNLVSNSDLHSMVLKRLQDDENEVAASRYEKHNQPLSIQVEQRDGQMIPFSRLEFQHNLETIGLDNDEASNVVQMLEHHLTTRHIEKISSRRLGLLTYRYLRQARELGPAVAHRWLVWRDFINSGRALIFLIGGASGCGKSTTATMLASRLDIARTQSTDMLREVMRTMIPRQLMPVLYESSFSAWTKLPRQPEDTTDISDTLLIQGYRSQADLLSVATEAVIQRAMRERVCLVLEGIHIHPAFMHSVQSQGNALVIPIMLGVLKRDLLERRIVGRSSHAPDRRAVRYTEHMDEIWRLQSYLLSEADRTNIPIVVNASRDKVFHEIMRYTINALEESFDGTPKKVFG